MITIWMPLADANLEDSCRHIMPRTHRRRLLSLHCEEMTRTGYLKTDTECLGTEHTPVPLPLTKEDTTPFNNRCIHPSMPDRSNHVCWAIILRYRQTYQDLMLHMDVKFLTRNRGLAACVANFEYWLARRLH